MITDAEFEQLCKELDIEVPTVFYDSQARPYTIDEKGNPEYFTPNSIHSNYNDISEKNNLTDEQRLCYHIFEFVGRSPVLNEEWWNCKECGVSREEYEKHKIQESKFEGLDWF